jgi:pimeloyl-ACP methyl ester carboxylesterase
MAQVWQTPGAGEEMIEAMIGGSLTDRQAIFAGLGAPADIAAAMAEGATPEMGRCILTLYRDAAQPVAEELGQRLLAAARPPALVILASDDPYVSAALGAETAAALGAEVLRLDGCGHWWMFEEPGRAADGLVAFWSSLD